VRRKLTSSSLAFFFSYPGPRASAATDSPRRAAIRDATATPQSPCPVVPLIVPIGLALEGGGALGLATSASSVVEDHRIPSTASQGQHGRARRRHYATGTLLPRCAPWPPAATSPTSSLCKLLRRLELPPRQDRRQTPSVSRRSCTRSQLRNAVLTDRGVNQFLATNLSLHPTAVDYNHLPIPFAACH